MNDAFKTTEDELNFILGNDCNDDEHLFANMNDGGVDSGKLLDACGVGGAADDDNVFAGMGGGAPNLNTAPAPVSRMVSQSLSHSLSTASFGVTATDVLGASSTSTSATTAAVYCGVHNATTDISTKFTPQEQELDAFDFNFDLTDDVLATATPAADAADCDGSQPFMPSLPPPNFGSSACHNNNNNNNNNNSNQTNNSMNLSRRYVPPIVHTDPLLMKSKRPFRKRKVDFTMEFLDCFINPTTADESQQGSIRQVDDPHAKATRERNARKMRRFKRAKSQAIHLVGGGDVAEIERIAVVDSDIGKIASMEEAELLNDFFAMNFDAKMFVGLTFESVHQTLMESCNNKEADDDKVLAGGKRGGYEILVPSTQCPTSPVPQTLFGTPPHLTTLSEQANNVVTPPSRKPSKPINDQLKELPSGKDPESRRLCQLMRNRLSAQASRDRRKKAIEDLQKQKVEKDKEIVLLKKTVSEVRVF